MSCVQLTDSIGLISLKNIAVGYNSLNSFPVYVCPSSAIILRDPGIFMQVLIQTNRSECTRIRREIKQNLVVGCLLRRGRRGSLLRRRQLARQAQSWVPYLINN